MRTRVNKEVFRFDIDTDSLIIEPFRPFLFDFTPVQLFIGNSGSGKSSFVYQRAILNTIYRPYCRIIFSRNVKDSMRDSIFLGLKDTIIEWDLKRYFAIRENKMDIVFKPNGNMLLSAGMDDPEKLKSIKDPTDWIYEEFSESDPEQFAEIRRRLRTSKVPQTTFTGMLNPVAGWWGRDYFLADPESEEIPLGIVPSKSNDVLIHKSTYHANPWIDPVEQRKKNEELAVLDENNWIIYEEGNWGKLNSGGAFYHQFKRRAHVKKVELIPEVAFHLTYDFNVLPYMTLLAAQVTSHYEDISGRQVMIYTVRVIREYCLKEPLNSSEAVTNAWIDEFGHYKTDVFLYGDAMGNKRHEGSGNKTEFKKIKDILFHFIDDSSDRTWRSNPSVRLSRDFLNKILAESNEIYPGVIIRLEIDPSCKELIQDMEMCKLAADGGKLKIKVKDKKTLQVYEKHNHASDALSYLLTKMFIEFFKEVSV